MYYVVWNVFVFLIVTLVGVRIEYTSYFISNYYKFFNQIIFTSIKKPNKFCLFTLFTKEFALLNWYYTRLNTNNVVNYYHMNNNVNSVMYKLFICIKYFNL